MAHTEGKIGSTLKIFTTGVEKL